MYKSLLLFIALAFTASASLAQHLYPEKFEGCEINSFILDGGNPKAKLALNYANTFIQNLNPAVLSKISGTIEAQILIDTFHPCWHSPLYPNHVSTRCCANGQQRGNCLN